ncbi:MAG: hypothetical protein WA750_19665 [Pseudolabrys sp.]
MAALNAGRLWASRIRLRLCAARAEFCHSGKKFSAMTERKPQLLEVLLAQTWRNIQINIVSREDLGIFFKANVF